MRAKKALVGSVAALGMLLVPPVAGATESPPERVPAGIDGPEREQRPTAHAFDPQGEFVPASNHPGSGYWMVDISGETYAFGSAEHFGNRSGQNPNCFYADQWGYCDISIDIEATPRSGILGRVNGHGYWMLATTGYLEAHGDAVDAPHFPDFGLRRNDPWMSITSTSDGEGLWGFSYQGCVETRGNATFYGDMCEVALNAPVVGSAVTPSGRGYYMVAQDGGIFSFGDAKFYGSTGHMRLNQPVTDMVVTASGKGYWLVAEDGGIFAFGDAHFYGSMGSVRLNQPVSGMVASPTGKGYLMVAEDGGIFAFGDVPFHGSLGSDPPYWPVVAITVR